MHVFNSVTSATQTIRMVASILVVLVIASCASEPIRNPVPHKLQDAAKVVDMPDIRVWGDGGDDSLHADIVQSIHDEPEGLFPRGPNGEFQYSSLALSGGGDHGAFGAGFLKGWSQSGTRPVFKIVTGISTGALIAPFAMLGPYYDEILQKAYTTVTVDDVMKKKSIAGAYWRESLVDNHPLQEMVHEVISDEVIDAIGVAHKKGQRLFIATTNFDAQRPVIWNMGAVANSKHPDAYALFRKILIASTSIPVLFPPAFVEVEVDGKTYEEMHVDGGTVGQMFFYGSSMDWQAVLRDASGIENPIDRSILYAIIDGEVDPEHEPVRRRLMPITDRTIKTLIKVSAWSALYRMYLHAEVGGYGFNFVNLPDDYAAKNKQPYDPEEMNRMFEIGYEMGLKGEGWQEIPPGF